MKRLLALSAALALALPVAEGLGPVGPGPAYAQGNDDDYTPLNSRIKRERQFPLAPPRSFDRSQMTEANRARSRNMVNEFAGCLYRRSNEDSLELLATTDFGFVNFDQIDRTAEELMREHGFNDCLRRLANRRNMSLQLQFYASGLRQWLLQEAYFDRYEDEPDWVIPGNVIGNREFPLSFNNSSVHLVMSFADCVVAADPYGADYLFRTVNESEEERAAIQELIPAIGSCIPEGVDMQIEPRSFKIWIGEGLWHASNNSAPPAPEETEAAG